MRSAVSTAEYAELLRALDAGRSVALLPNDARAHLFVAVAHAGAGRWAEARDAVRAAISTEPESGLVHLIAGMVRYVTRDYADALDALARAVELSPRLAARAYALAITRASRLGWHADVRAILDRARQLEPRNLRWHLEAARVHTGARSYADAARCLREAVALEQGSATLFMELANVAARAEDPALARASVERALALGRDDLRYLLEAARVYTAIGRLDEAAAALRRAADAHPRDPRPRVELAERALWAMELDAAVALASEAVAWNAPGGHRVLGAVAVLRGDPEAALDRLAEATAGVPSDYVAHVWMGEALLRLGRHDEAHAALTRASMAADGFLPVAWLLRMWVALDEGEPALVLRAHRFGEVQELLLAVDPTARAAIEDGGHDAVRACLARVLARLGGNRTTLPTMLAEGGLVRLPPLTGVRFESRKALELVRARSPEAALAALSAVVDRFPGHALPECHRGELLLWLGRLEEARASLERAIEIHPETRWAYIGLTGIDILEGRLEAALETSARGVRAMGDTEGPAVYVYRGEALRRLGRTDEALADLRRACALHPSRAAARVDLALALMDAGDPDRELPEIVATLVDQAGGLLSDAARELGVCLHPARGELTDGDSLRRVLEHALALLRGNRSSTVITYLTRDGLLRYVPHYPHAGRGPHDTDRDDLERARTILMRATGLSDGPPRERAPEARRSTTLTEQDLASFAEKGFVRVRGALSRERATEWVAAANRRIQNAPHRYVKGYDPSDPRRDLSRYDPRDPETWTWERLDVEGDQSVPIAEIAPRAWTAMCELLGGEDRIATRSMSDYFIVNLRERADDPRTAPGESWSSWHLDDPQRDATLTDYRNGLVAICLFSDVGPRSGGTWVLTDSVRHVAAFLAAHPDGCDLRATETALEIARRCERFEELTGETGDVFLLHPFMLHSSSPNPSGRARWMANPVIYTREPLVFDRPDPAAYSQVELAVARALGRA